jgi:hypothetical protein
VHAFAKDGIFARAALLEVSDYAPGVRTGMEVLRGIFFKPNILFLPVTPDSDETTLQFMLDRAIENDMGAILFARHPETGIGQEQAINVWIRDQSPAWEVGLRLSNLDLNLLLAYQLARNWQADITLLTLIASEAEQANGEQFLADLINIGRTPRQTRAIVQSSALDDYLPNAPLADLHIFGLQEQVNLSFIQNMVTATNASCIFVRSSGQESALA